MNINQQNALRFLAHLPKDIPLPYISFGENYESVFLRWEFRRTGLEAIVSFYTEDNQNDNVVLGYTYTGGPDYDQYLPGEVDVTNPDRPPEDLIKYLRDAMELFDYEI